MTLDLSTDIERKPVESKGFDITQGTQATQKDVVVETWMFQITRYPNGRTFPGKLWQVKKGIKVSKSKKKKGKKLQEVEINDIESY